MKKISIDDWRKAKERAAAKTVRRPPMTETERRAAIKAARKAYDREHMVTVTCKLHRDYDADIIEHLEDLSGSRQAYIKALIRADMEMTGAGSAQKQEAGTDEWWDESRFN